jgi:radical SAM protein with 4Fe4S-binding SPASM domain
MSELFVKMHNDLPVFAVDCGTYTSLYSPGYAVKVGKIGVNELMGLIHRPTVTQDATLRDKIAETLTNAQDVAERWKAQISTPFNPECLTIHVGSDCNLNCYYCYSRKGGTDNKPLRGFPELDAIKAAFRCIVSKRNDRQKAISIVFHGSGEPTFHWDKLVNSYKALSKAAKFHKQKVFFYIATNACLKEYQLDWLIDKMDLIGISCDGPDDAAQNQRGNPGLKFTPVQKICKKIRERGGKFEIRTTITPETLSGLKRTVEYFIDKCVAETIRIEPVFLADENGFIEDDADTFFELYTAASKYAKFHGVTLSYSGVRMNEQHSTYCDILRNNLRLTADNSTHNCFWLMSDKKEFITGVYDKGVKSSFTLDPGLNELKTRTGFIPETCQNCINIYHCSRGCPDFCIFTDGKSENGKLNPFRCRLHKLLAVERIRNAVLIPD